jgi:hypothetical protein
MTWDICSKAGEDCPFHDRYLRLSTRHRNLKPIRFEFMRDPKQKGSIQEIIDRKYGNCELRWEGNLTFTPDDLDSNVKNEPMRGKGHVNHCPYDGTRKHHCVMLWCLASACHDYPCAPRVVTRWAYDGPSWCHVMCAVLTQSMMRWRYLASTM